MASDKISTKSNGESSHTATGVPQTTIEIFKNGFSIQIVFINRISNTKEPKAIVSSTSLLKFGNLVSMTLDTLQEVLDKKVDSKWSFCLENCTPVDFSSGLLYYLTLEEINVKKLQTPARPKPDEPLEAAVLPVLSAFMTVGDPMAPVPKGFGAEWAEKNKPDLALTDRSKGDLAAPETSAKAEYASQAVWAKTTSLPTATGMLDCVVDFADSDWNKIMMLNKVLYAFDIRPNRPEITNARLPAFELKDVSTTTQSGPFLASASPQSSGVGGSTKPAHLRPFVEINDTPNIDISEITSDFHSSLVNNAFSSTSLDIMASGGTPVFSASASAGLKSESSKGSGSSEAAQRKEYHATYNFPRVRLFLDESTLTVSEDCGTALKALQASPTLDNLRLFQRRFGIFYAQEVILGGRLESTKTADAQSSGKNSSAKDAFKASLGAAVSYGPASASMKVGTESQSNNLTNSDQQRGTSAISYTARGGDTLLCADPAAWAATVAVWRNWRVIQQDEPVILHEMLGRFNDYSFVPKLFATILSQVPQLQEPPKPVSEKIFSKDVKWKSRIQLWIGQERLPAMVIAVRDGNPEYEGAGPRSNLLADFPLLLFKETTEDYPGRDASTIYVNTNTGTIGPQSDNIGTYRFSFRRVGASGPWQPLNNLGLANGDKVTMWCHSVGLGGWKSLEAPPDTARQACFNKATKELKFNTEKVALSPDSGFEPASFNIEFV